MLGGRGRSISRLQLEHHLSLQLWGCHHLPLLHDLSFRPALAYLQFVVTFVPACRSLRSIAEMLLAAFVLVLEMLECLEEGFVLSMLGHIVLVQLVTDRWKSKLERVFEEVLLISRLC